MEPSRVQGQQITMGVEPHPSAVRDRLPLGWIDAEVSISGIAVKCDLNPGDEITVLIGSADGEQIGSATCEVGGVSFKPVKADGAVVGTTRVHKAKVV